MKKKKRPPRPAPPLPLQLFLHNFFPLRMPPQFKPRVMGLRNTEFAHRLRNTKLSRLT
jgi:hypothetical protein